MRSEKVCVPVQFGLYNTSVIKMIELIFLVNNSDSISLATYFLLVDDKV